VNALRVCDGRRTKKIIDDPSKQFTTLIGSPVAEIVASNRNRPPK
jgi:hypothetical protein